MDFRIYFLQKNINLEVHFTAPNIYFFQDFRLDFFLKHHWAVSQNVCSFHLDCQNEQEFVTSSAEYTDLGHEQSIIINAKEVKHMWLPDTYIGNSKVVETPAKDSSTSFIIIKRREQQCAVEYTLRYVCVFLE